MEQLNYSLFEAVNATDSTHPVLMSVGEFAAVYLIYLVPATLVIGWVVGGDELRRILLEVFVAIAVALGVSTLIGTIWPHPRPFVADIGNTYLDYDATPSFPSNHGTILLTMAVGLLIQKKTRLLGALFVLVAVPVAWARVFVGIHFPFDMFGAVALSIVAAVGVAASRDWHVVPLYEKVARPLFRRLFAPLIDRGWVRE